MGMKTLNKHFFSNSNKMFFMSHNNFKKFANNKYSLYVKIDKNSHFKNSFFSISNFSFLVSVFNANNLLNNVTTHNCIFIPILTEHKIERLIAVKINVIEEVFSNKYLLDFNCKT